MIIPEQLDSINQYGDYALRTLAPAIKDNLFMSTMNAATGLASENGELEEIFSSQEARDPVHLQKELGDWAWYWSLMNFAYSRTNSSVLGTDSIRAYMIGRYPELREAQEEGIAYGLGAVTGAINEFVKKQYFHFHPYDSEHATKLAELMDKAFLAWVQLVVSLEFSPQQVLALNIQKLAARYPDGFSTERSLHRAANDV